MRLPLLISDFVALRIQGIKNRVLKSIEPGAVVHELPPHLQAAALTLLQGKDMTIAAQAAGYASEQPLKKAFQTEGYVAADGLGGLTHGKPCPLLWPRFFDAAYVLRYLGRYPQDLAEVVEGKTYRRFIPIANADHPLRQVEIAITLCGEQGAFQLPKGLSTEAALQAYQTVIHLLNLPQPLPAFLIFASKHPLLKQLTRQAPFVRIPQIPTVWEALCWAIIGQQINLSFAYRLRNRLIELAAAAHNTPLLRINNSSLPPNNGGIFQPKQASESVKTLHPFPSPAAVLQIAAEDWKKAQFSRQKTNYIQGLAEQIVSGALNFEELTQQPDELVCKQLLAVKGVGTWSAAYAMLRALARCDVVPVGDAVLKAALKQHFHLSDSPNAEQQMALLEPFKPYRGMVVGYLWFSMASQKIL